MRLFTRSAALLFAVIILVLAASCSGNNVGLQATPEREVAAAAPAPHGPKDPKPVAVPAVVPSKAGSPVQAHFSDGGSTAAAGHHIVKWEWQFKGGGLSKDDRKWVDYTSTHGDVWKTLTKSATGKLRVTDETGRRSDPRGVKVKVSGKGNAAPIADIDLATVNGTTFQLIGSSSYDPDGTIVKWEWDFDGDGVYDYSSATSSDVSHSFMGGPHSVALRVTDNDGATDVDTGEVVGNYPPTAHIDLGTANGTSFQFSGAGSTDPEGPIFRYEWDFNNDGIFEESSFTDPTATHSFSGGPHQVSLRVTDGLDATDTATITVTGNYPPVADIQVETLENDPGIGRLYALDFSGSHDVEGPLQSAFYTVNGGPPQPIDINNNHPEIFVDTANPVTVILYVVDGLDATSTELVSLTVDGPVFAME